MKLFDTTPIPSGYTIHPAFASGIRGQALRPDSGMTERVRRPVMYSVWYDRKSVKDAYWVFYVEGCPHRLIQNQTTYHQKAGSDQMWLANRILAHLAKCGQPAVSVLDDLVIQNDEFNRMVEKLLGMTFASPSAETENQQEGGMEDGQER